MDASGELWTDLSEGKLAKAMIVRKEAQGLTCYTGLCFIQEQRERKLVVCKSSGRYSATRLQFIGSASKKRQTPAVANSDPSKYI